MQMKEDESKLGYQIFLQIYQFWSWWKVTVPFQYFLQVNHGILQGKEIITGFTQP
jgi:hypothetical protein